MPWGDNNNGKGPWGQGNQPKQKPDNNAELDRILQAKKEQFARIIGGNNGGNGGNDMGFNPRVIAIAVIAAFFIWLASGIYTVAPEEQGVVLRFGDYDRWSGPGLHYHLPSPIEKVTKVPVTTVNRVEVGARTVSTSRTRGESQKKVTEESLMLTGDENIVDVDFEVQWRIRDARNFLFEVKSPADTVKSVAESAMREVIGRTAIADALTEGRQSIEQQAREISQQMLDRYNSGVEIVRLQLREVQPPREVIDAFRDVQNAKTEKEAMINQAEAYRNDIIPRARGEAEQIVQEAEAYREGTVAVAIGKADRFVKIYNEFKNAKAVTKDRMYLETLEEVMSGMDKIILSSEQGVVPYLPLNELKK